jgi:hypothetical protein
MDVERCTNLRKSVDGKVRSWCALRERYVPSAGEECGTGNLEDWFVTRLCCHAKVF